MNIFPFAVGNNVKVRLTSSAFSLVELLMVIAVISILAALSIPAFNALKTAGNLNQSASNISGILDGARAYAMSNNTYVYVGVQEVDGISPTSTDGTGCIAIMVMASQDGLRPTLTGTTATFPRLTTDVTAISKVQILPNTHFTQPALLSSTGSMARPTGATDLGSASVSTTFQWPLTGTARFKFTKVLEYDPQGTARLQPTTGYVSSVPLYVELAMVPAHGNTPPTSTPLDQAAIQIQGITGAVRAYRP